MLFVQLFSLIKMPLFSLHVYVGLFINKEAFISVCPLSYGSFFRSKCVRANEIIKNRI